MRTYTFTPSHPAVSRQLRSRLVWLQYNVVAAGGAYISAKRLKARFCAPETAAIAITSPLTINPN